jgi:hypothetical protein
MGHIANFWNFVGLCCKFLNNGGQIENGVKLWRGKVCFPQEIMRQKFLLISNQDINK